MSYRHTGTIEQTHQESTHSSHTGLATYFRFSAPQLSDTFRVVELLTDQRSTQRLEEQHYSVWAMRRNGWTAVVDNAVADSPTQALKVALNVLGYGLNMMKEQA